LFYYSEKILITRLADNEFVFANLPLLNDSITNEISFYPEGNNLIEGIETKIGIKVNFSDTSSNSITGTVKDKNDSSIVTFRTNESGIGLFSFKPLAGKSYHAE